MVKIIAELSWCHMGSIKLIDSMVKAASESGADYVKFQTWSVPKLVSGPWDTDGRRQIYEKAELTKEKHFEAKKICDKYGVNFLTSCFNADDLEFISSLTSEVKIPSPEASNDDLVPKAAKLFDTLYVSTGACSFEEYARWIDIPQVVLMHCISSYPAVAENFHIDKLNFIKGISDQFGFSGHSPDIWDAVLAITHGSSVVEKHFTIDNDLPGRDNKFALLPPAFKQLREFADYFIKTQDSLSIKEILDCEKEYRENHKGRWG